MKKFKFIALLFFFLHFILMQGQEAIPQNPENDMGELEAVEDKFQEYFFEALKQKAIENYRPALEALRKAETAATDNDKKSVVFFEMGKNYFKLKEYQEAEENYKKSIKLTGDRLDVLEHVYDLYHKQNNYQKALEIVLKLIPFDENYKEDLANLYVHTKQYDEALELLDELENSWGASDIRSSLKARIYSITGNTEGAIADLEQKIDANPKNEKEYLNLIFLYSDQGETEKAFETAESLLTSNPDSKLVHLALYKFYLDKNQPEKSVNSMKIVFSSNEIDKETKYRVLSDFINFVQKNPDYKDELNDVVELFSDEHSGIYSQLGDYFLSQNKKEQALKFYKEGYSRDSENYHLLSNLLLLELETENYTEAETISSDGLEIFPAQPLLYLLNGVANNGLEKYKKAIENLEMGLDFVYDNPKMEQDFYKQLSLAYQKSGNPEKAAIYTKKATEIKISNP